MNWKISAAGLFLLGIGLYHAICPEHLLLDWPTVTLLVLGLIILSAERVKFLLPYIKKIKWGESEIELQEKLSELNAEVEDLQERVPAPTANHNIKQLADTSIESIIIELAAKDKESALVRLAIEIEKEMVLLHQSLGLKLTRPTWRELVNGLTESKVLDPQLARAVIEFRNIRNQVIHSGFGGPVQGRLLTQAIDNGLQLLRILKGLAR